MNPAEQLYAVLESRYEALIEHVDDTFVATVWLVTKTDRSRLATFIDVDEQAARDAAYTFLMERPR